MGSFFERIRSTKSLLKKGSANNFDLYYNLGIKLQNEKKHKESIDAFTEGISINSNNCNIYFLRGSSYYNLKLYDDAIRDTVVAIQLSYLDENNYANEYYQEIGFGSAKEYYEDQLKLYERVKTLVSQQKGKPI